MPSGTTGIATGGYRWTPFCSLYSLAQLQVLCSLRAVAKSVLPAHRYYRRTCSGTTGAPGCPEDDACPGPAPCNRQMGSGPAVPPLVALRYYRRPGRRPGRADSAVVPLSLRRYYRWGNSTATGGKEREIFSPPLLPSTHFFFLTIPHHQRRSELQASRSPPSTNKRCCPLED